ncbi:uncharacterized protein LOC124284843 [Haliotis rubra]|uniref:uncharacterized protein LOC124284843 n=1 Tax=Haliotis rubra TaxID=36100 RepID=UPI001EE61504|nr:uncharacterized protein LOC124284843 [Haliotis rubra]
MATVLSLVLFFGLFHSSDGILCYTCGAAGGEGECISGYSLFLDVYRHVMNNNTKHVNDAGSRYPGYADCDTFPEQTVCMIEEVRESKTRKILSYIRGCSDGVTFSFNLANLKGLKPSNTTTCGFDTRGYRPCVTLCKSDFCNGPSGATRSHLSLAMTVICLVVLYCKLRAS